jgi:two-component system, LytTR family, sensor kinase
METGTFNKLKNRRLSLFFHLLVLSLAVVIDLPHSLPSLLSPYGFTGYVLSRIFPLIVFYSCYFWLVPAFLANRKFIPFVLLLLILINGVTLVGFMCMQLLHQVFFHEKVHFFYHTAMHLSGSLAMSVAAAFGIVFRIVAGWFREMQNARMLEEEKLRSELMLLKAQVNPHFLFNTLNNIDSLILTDQARASEALIKLSSLLRYVIYDAVKDQVPLQMELEHIGGYIDLQRLRYAGMSAISFVAAGNPEGKMVAPVLFMPFIENAFKHTGAEGIAKGLDVRFLITPDSIDFYCSNYATPADPSVAGGFGLDNVKKRLDIQYPGRYILQTGYSGEKYITNLTIRL